MRYIHVTLHKALKDAVGDGLLPKNVAAGLKPSKTRGPEINPLNPEQAKKFLKAAHDDRYEAIYVLALNSAGLYSLSIPKPKFNRLFLPLKVRRNLNLY